MKRSSTEISRRALLGAACAVPFTAAPPSPVRFERSREAAPSAAEALLREWDRVLTRFRRAESALAALEGHPDEDAYGRAHDAFNAALRSLLATPAPGIAALADKLKIADEAELADLTFAPPSLRALAHDARRLALRSS
jgi:hypothetical protein